MLVRALAYLAIFALCLGLSPVTFGQDSRTLVAVWAHADDEAPVGPILARYAREDVRVHDHRDGRRAGCCQRVRSARS